MKDSESAAAKLQAITGRIKAAAEQSGRPVDSITLIGAAKQQASDRVATYCAAGLGDIGHNYLQEAAQMRTALANLDPQPIWHFIGAIQSNKTKEIAANFDWVHSVDRLKIARRLSDQRQALGLPKLNILLQVNVDAEPTKAGIVAEQVIEVARGCADLEGIKLRGLMALPRARQELEQQREPFKRLRELMLQCNAEIGTAMDSLSMGMSNDLEAAVLEGSTMVRIGTALFGARPQK